MTTFRALANPAFVAVTETVTLSPWTSASFDTVCCCVQREKESEKRRRRRRQREVTRIIIGGCSQKERHHRLSKSVYYVNSIGEPTKVPKTEKKRVLNHHHQSIKVFSFAHLLQQNVRVFRSEREGRDDGRRQDAKKDRF